MSRFLFVFSSIPRKLYTIFQPTFYQDIFFKLLNLSTNCVTKKIFVVRTAYFYNSGCTLSKTLYEVILASLDREKYGLERVYNFLGKDEKTEKSLFTFA